MSKFEALAIFGNTPGAKKELDKTKTEGTPAASR